MFRFVVLSVLASGAIALLVVTDPVALKWSAATGANRPTETQAAPAVSEKKPAEPQKVAVPEKKKPTVDKSPAMQEGRKKLIQKLISERVFTKIDTPGTSMRVYVAPRFYTLDFDMKQQFVSVVYTYAYDGSGDYEVVRVMDSRTNKSVGSFTKELGLRLD